MSRMGSTKAGRRARRHEGPPVKFAWIQAEKATYPLTKLCRWLDVTRSGLYAWRARPESTHAREDRRLTVLVRASFEASKQRYGSPRPIQRITDHASRKQNAGEVSEKCSGIMSLPARSAMICTPLPASANPQAGPEDIQPTPQRGEDAIGGGGSVEQIDAPARSRRVMAREGRRATGGDRMRKPMRPTGAPAASCGCDLARAGPPGTGRAHARRRDARLPCR